MTPLLVTMLSIHKNTKVIGPLILKDNIIVAPQKDKEDHLSANNTQTLKNPQPLVIPVELVTLNDTDLALPASLRLLQGEGAMIGKESINAVSF